MIAPRGAFFSFDFAGPEDIRLTQEQQDALDLWGSDVNEFCTGSWPLPRHVQAKGSFEPKPIIWTQDNLRREPRPFPRFEYLRGAVLDPIFKAPKADDYGLPFKLRMIGWKPRQVFWSNAALIGMLWDVLFNESSQWLVCKNKKPEAQGFIEHRIRYSFERTPYWFRDWANVPAKPRGSFEPPRTSSRILPVARTFGESGEAVGETASVFLDEAIRLKGLRGIWKAADAQAPRLIAVSAPPEKGIRIDADSLACFREMAEDLPEGSLSDLTNEVDELDEYEDDEPVSALA